VQVVEALRYKLEGHGVNTQRCHWNFSLTESFCPRYGPQVGSTEMSSRNISWRIKAAGADNLTTLTCGLS